MELREADSAERAASIVRGWRPDLLILDVGLPGLDGLTFCRGLKDDGGSEAPAVVLLTGAELTQAEAHAAGADALLRKPFSPLDLLELIGRLVASRAPRQTSWRKPRVAEHARVEQLQLYARDMSELLALERHQRSLLEDAYRQTVSALAKALEWKDAELAGHSLRVQSYALELTAAAEPALLQHRSLEGGFLLHDIGKIAIPDSILRKRGPLTDAERRLMCQHTVIGSELLAGISLLEGEGLAVVRSHHERWDGAGYPDGLAGEEIPVAARIFALADALDAMTTDRPYRSALTWESAGEEFAAQAGRQFDPAIVAAFWDCEEALKQLHPEPVLGLAADAPRGALRLG
jgi:cyclic di-GMP phosphodiesterase